MLSKFSKNFREVYLKAVKKVFCYLKNIQNLWLTYKEAGENLAGFINTDSNMVEYHMPSLPIWKIHLYSDTALSIFNLQVHLLWQPSFL